MNDNEAQRPSMVDSTVKLLQGLYYIFIYFLFIVALLKIVFLLPLCGRALEKYLQQ
jgi:hypothetical protein